MFSTRVLKTTLSLGILALSGLLSPAIAGPTAITVTITNLAPANSVSFAPLRLGFGNGTFDAFNNGQTALAPIISIAEGGSGSAWFPAFAAAESNAVLGSVINPATGGPLLPGQSASNTFLVDNTSSNNRFFTFANMVLPSNDLFLGNDSPTAFQLFNPDGSLALTTITQTAGQIWDSGDEASIVANAAFIPGSDNNARVAENGVVRFDRANLSIFNGITTAGGYVFSDAALTNATPIYRISFTAAPEPGSLLFLAAGAGILAIKRRRRAQ